MQIVESRPFPLIRARPRSPTFPSPSSSSSSFFVCSIGCDDGVERRKGKEKKQKKLFPADLSSPTFCSVFARFSTFKKGLVVRRRHPPRRRTATDGALRVRLPSPPAPTPHCTGEGGKLGMTRVGFQSRKRGREKNCLALLFYILPFSHRMEREKGDKSNFRFRSALPSFLTLSLHPFLIQDYYIKVKFLLLLSDFSMWLSHASPTHTHSTHDQDLPLS